MSANKQEEIGKDLPSKHSTPLKGWYRVHQDATLDTQKDNLEHIDQPPYGLQDFLTLSISHRQFCISLSSFQM